MKRTSNTLKSVTGKLLSKNFTAMLVVILLAGFTVGSIAAGYVMPESSLFDSILSISGCFKSSLGSLILKSFFMIGIQLIFLYAVGFWAFSQPLSLAVLLVYGAGFGTTVSLLYRLFGLKGIFFAAFLLIPQGALGAIIVILAVRESVKLSNMLAGVFFSGGEGPSRKVLKLFTKKFTVLLIGGGILCGIFSLLKIMTYTLFSIN